MTIRNNIFSFIQFQESRVRKTSVLEVMRRLLQAKNLMVSAKTDKGAYLSILNIIQGEVDASQIYQSLQRIRESKTCRFIDWAPTSLHVALSRKSPYIQSAHRVTGLSIANHTSIAGVFDRILKQYDRLKQRNAFINVYQKEKIFADGLEEFDESRTVLSELIEEYQAAESGNYLNWGMTNPKPENTDD